LTNQSVLFPNGFCLRISGLNGMGRGAMLTLTKEIPNNTCKQASRRPPVVITIVYRPKVPAANFLDILHFICRLHFFSSLIRLLCVCVSSFFTRKKASSTAGLKLLRCAFHYSCYLIISLLLFPAGKSWHCTIISQSLNRPDRFNCMLAHPLK
jgi:hypothetical protein